MKGSPVARGFVVVLAASGVALAWILGLALLVLVLAAAAVTVGPLLVIILLYLAAGTREAVRDRR